MKIITVGAAARMCIAKGMPRTTGLRMNALGGAAAAKAARLESA